MTRNKTNVLLDVQYQGGERVFLVSSPLLPPQILLYVSPNYFSKTILDCCLSQFEIEQK